ncbi:MAG: adenosine deaminase [Bdellovibrionaceae bacterium]|nr:adenosine deaminase [Pseudobdellovibrionaceae bacterium]
MSPSKLYSHDLRAIPKVDLHRHLDCSMRWSTMVELAPLAGLELPKTYQAQRDFLLVTKQMKDLGAVLKKFLNAQKILNSEMILTRLAFEACEDAFNDGVRILELRYAPTFIADGHSHLSFEKIHLSFLKGLEIARKRFPLAVGLICILQRVKPVSEAAAVCDFAVEHKDSLLGLDLADDEDGFDPRQFSVLFKKAERAGLGITVHSGEVNTPTSAKSVKDSIEILGAKRIGHGIQIIKDQNILNFVRDRRIPLEVCPISNWLTQAFKTHEEHPIRNLINAGVLVTINSDDPGVFATQLSDDYDVLHRVHNFQMADFNHANDVAAKASFLKLEEKQRVWPRKILL